MSNYCTNCKWLGKESIANKTQWLCKKYRSLDYRLQSLCGNPAKLLQCINENWYEAKNKSEINKLVKEYCNSSQFIFKEMLKQEEKMTTEEMIKVIMFTSTTCLPCEKMKPVLSSVCDELSISLDFIWKETDKNDLFNKYNVLSVPTFIIMKKDQDQWIPFNSYIGTKSRKELVLLLTQYKEL